MGPVWNRNIIPNSALKIEKLLAWVIPFQCSKCHFRLEGWTVIASGSLGQVIPPKPCVTISVVHPNASIVSSKIIVVASRCVYAEQIKFSAI